MLKRLWHSMPFTADPPPVVNHLPLQGAISSSARVGGRVLNLATLEPSLVRAFKHGSPRAVVLSINSPGGSPAQSRMILARVRELAEELKIPVMTHIEDVGASGGYMIALAGDEIYADPFGIVGSIGVIAGGFGFDKAIERLGIDRRIYTAGENKSQLDPFKPEDPEDVSRLNKILEQSHAAFVATVKDRRGDRLAAADDVLFSGQFWLAPDAHDLGLIDGAEDMRALLRRRFGDRVKIRRIEPERKGPLARLLSSVLAGVWGPDAILGSVERTNMWRRFGQ